MIGNKQKLATTNLLGLSGLTLFCQTTVLKKKAKKFQNQGRHYACLFFFKMKIINRILFTVNSVFIAALTIIGIYASKDYSFSILLDIIHSLVSIREFLWL